MALVSCSACSQKIRDSAEKCPKCGESRILEKVFFCRDCNNPIKISDSYGGYSYIKDGNSTAGFYVRPCNKCGCKKPIKRSSISWERNREYRKDDINFLVKLLVFGILFLLIGSIISNI